MANKAVEVQVKDRSNYWNMIEENFWIGDQVLLIKSNRQGTYEGANPNGKHRIKVDGKIVLSSIANLTKVDIPKLKPAITFDDSPSTTTPRYRDFNKSIDLHIEKLDPELLRQPPQMILRRQLAACKNHIDTAISVGAKIIIIIHGKGTGELKKEVDYILSQYPEIHFSNPINNGGATEVWLR